MRRHLGVKVELEWWWAGRSSAHPEVNYNSQDLRLSPVIKDFPATRPLPSLFLGLFGHRLPEAGQAYRLSPHTLNRS